MTRPVAQTHMLIRKPVADVFEAFVDPAVTSRFWFTRGSARLAEGSTVQWHWDVYGASADVAIKTLEPGHRLLIEWPSPVEWIFEPREGGAHCFVTITASGFTGDDGQQSRAAIDSMGGFSFVLAGCKAWLEHGVELNLIRDFQPPSPAA